MWAGAQPPLVQKQLPQEWDILLSIPPPPSSGAVNVSSGKEETGQVAVLVCCDEHRDQRQLKEERVYLHFSGVFSPSQILKGSK